MVETGEGIGLAEGRKRAEFEILVNVVGFRLRRAFIAAYGYERGIEATAEALAYAWEHWERLSGISNVAGYLYRVGQSRTRRTKVRVVFEPALTSEPNFEPALASALESLPERQRIAVLLAYGDEWSLSEIADLLGVRKATVQKHLERGLARLQKAVGAKES